MQKKPFTLMEVMIAALVLALAAASTLSIVGTGRAKMLREERRWAKEHYLTNVVEFFLSVGPGEQPPACLLPERWYATCELNDVEEGLPDEAFESIRQWRLGEFHICLYDDSGTLVEEQFIRKLLKEDDVGYESTGAD